MITKEKIFLGNFQSNDGTIKIPRVEKYKLLNEEYNKIIEKEIYNLVNIHGASPVVLSAYFIKANLLEQAKEIRKEKSCYKYNHYKKVSAYCKNWSNIKHNDKDALVSLSCNAISEAIHWSAELVRNNYGVGVGNKYADMIDADCKITLANFLIFDLKIVDEMISEDPEKNLENLLLSKKLTEI